VCVGGGVGGKCDVLSVHLDAPRFHDSVDLRVVFDHHRIEIFYFFAGLRLENVIPCPSDGHFTELIEVFVESRGQETVLLPVVLVPMAGGAVS